MIETNTRLLHGMQEEMRADQELVKSLALRLFPVHLRHRPPDCPKGSGRLAALQQASKAAALDARMRLLETKLDVTEKKLKASDVPKDAARRGKLLADRQLQGFRERLEERGTPPAVEE